MISTVVLALVLFILVLRGIQTNLFSINTKSSFIFSQFGLLIDGLNPVNLQSTPLVLYWKLLYLIRCILTVSLLIFLRDYPALQVILLQLLSFLTLLIYCKYHIYFDSWDNRMQVLNESAVFIYQYLLLSLLDDSASIDTRQLLGWCLALVQLSTVTCNVARLCHKIIVVARVKIVKMRSKRGVTVRIRAVQEDMREDVSDEMSVSQDVTRQHNVTSDSYHHGFEVEMD